MSYQELHQIFHHLQHGQAKTNTIKNYSCDYGYNYLHAQLLYPTHGIRTNQRVLEGDSCMDAKKGSR